MRRHSSVDLITNSSSEIYSCSCNGASKECREILDKIVKAVDPKKTVDDIFEIEEYVDPRWIKAVFEIQEFDEDLTDEEIAEAQKTGIIKNCSIEHILLSVYLKKDPEKTNILDEILNLYEAYDIEQETLGYEYY